MKNPSSTTTGLTREVAPPAALLKLAPPLLEFTALDVALEFQQAGKLSRFGGPMLRGAIANAVKLVACRPDAAGVCKPAQGGCAYHDIFESVDPTAQAALLAPFTLSRLSMPSPVTRRSRLCFRFTLFGRAQNHLHALLASFEKLGEHGIGSDRLKAKLVPVGEDGQPISDAALAGWLARRTFDPQATAPSTINVTLRSPVRIKWLGDFARAEAMTPAVLVGAAERRLRALALQWGKGEPTWAPIDAGQPTVTASDLKDTQQGRTRPIVGVMGSLRVTGLPPDAMQILRWAAHIGLGQGTSWGQGELSVRD